MQLGKFIFRQEPEPSRVFIQIEGDGEAGYFNWSDVPDAVKIAIQFPNILTKAEAAKAAVEMQRFWEEKF